MKLLIRWGATLGLFGSFLLGPSLVGNLRALALNEDQIVQKLDSVPVFVITNKEGLPLSRPLPSGQNDPKNGGAITGVYISRLEAQSVVDQLRNTKDKDPKLTDLVKTLQVTPVPLGVIYKQVRDTAKQPNRLVFAFKPVQQQVDAALTMLRQRGQKLEQFSGVPVFAVRFGPDKGYVSIKLPTTKNEIIPLFLSDDDAQNLLGQVKKKYSNADVQVIDVDSVIQTWRSKNDQWLNQVVIVPDAQTRDFIRALPQQDGGASPQSPAPATPQKPKP